MGQRAAKQLVGRTRVVALTSSPEKAAGLRAQGITPVQGNLDDANSLQRLSGWATRVLHLAPPPSDRVGEWSTDSRTLNLVRALKKRTLPQALVYGSTSGVYGDCQGEWVSESRPVHPHTPRAVRRVDAENTIRFLGRTGVRSSILRIPGIYAPNRPNGTPRERLIKGTPVLLKRPPRVPRSQAQESLPLMLLSFMSESRRLTNFRLKKELRLQLHYPTIFQGLYELNPSVGVELKRS